MRKRLLFLFLICSTILAQAQHIVTGIVTSSEDKQPIIGSAVMVKGTQKGTVTDYDGNYSVDAPLNSTLVFSYMGMKTQEIKVTGNKLNVVLQPSAIEVDEVVVTAMGVKQEKKNLNFAVSTVNADDIMAAKSTNFVDALQGKVAGLTVTNGGGSPNAASRTLIRGVSSMSPMQDASPLFVVDGIPVSGGMGQINPNDIENVTVLKGAAAAALYGQEAANGAIMVTTKAGKVGKITTNVSATFQIDRATRLPELQSKWGPGALGVYREQTMGGWGPPLLPGEQIYDNVGEFFETGILQKYDASLSAGSEKFNAYASVGFQSHEGIVPNDYQNKFNLLLKTTFTPIKSLIFNFNANIIKTDSRDAGSKRGQSLGSIYNWPINDQMSYYKEANGSYRWLYQEELLQDSPVNPYISRMEDDEKYENWRSLLQASVSWEIIKGLKLDGRAGYDFSSSFYDYYQSARFKKSDFSDEDLPNVDKSFFGQHINETGRSGLFSLLGMLSYEREVINDFKVSALVGSEMKIWDSKSTDLGGRGYIIPDGFDSQQNLEEVFNGRDIALQRTGERLYSYFGELKFDYKGLLNISATIRNDNTSTLAPSNRSYWYPSITGGITFSELFNISNKYFSYGKLRGNWAKVGKKTRPYLFDEAYKRFALFPDNGFGINPSNTVAFPTLKPEMIRSWEIGADLRFFENKTKLDVAYYSTGVDDQIVSVRVSPTSGYILMTKNEGSITNRGVEISLNQQILQTRNWTWSVNGVFGRNKGTVVSLPDGIIEIANTGAAIGSDIYPVAYLGGSLQGISGKDYLRTDDGKIICNEDGYPIVDPSKGLYLGNREPDFNAGLSSSLRYKNMTLSFLFDFRKGGDVVNGTKRYLLSTGQSKMLETYRNREILVEGVVKNSDGGYEPNTKKVIFDQNFVNSYFNPVSTNFIEDGSFIRLSYVTFNIDLSKYLKSQSVKGLNFSVTGRNLFLLTKYQGSDPVISSGKAAYGAGDVGLDYLGVPNTRTFSFGLTATF